MPTVDQLTITVMFGQNIMFAFGFFLGENLLLASIDRACLSCLFWPGCACFFVGCTFSICLVNFQWVNIVNFHFLLQWNRIYLLNMPFKRWRTRRKTLRNGKSGPCIRTYASNPIQSIPFKLFIMQPWFDMISFHRHYYHYHYLFIFLSLSRSLNPWIYKIRFLRQMPVHREHVIKTLP